MIDTNKTFFLSVFNRVSALLKQTLDFFFAATSTLMDKEFSRTSRQCVLNDFLLSTVLKDEMGRRYAAVTRVEMTFDPPE